MSWGSWVSKGLFASLYGILIEGNTCGLLLIEGDWDFSAAVAELFLITCLYFTSFFFICGAGSSYKAVIPWWMS